MSLVVSELHRQRQRAVQVIERPLDVAPLRLDAAHREQRVDPFRVAVERPGEVVARLIESAAVLVDHREVELHLGTVGRHLEELLVRLDGLLGVVDDARMGGEHQITFGRRQPFAQLHGAAREARGFVVVVQAGVGLPELRKRQSEIRVRFGGCLEALERVGLLALARQLESLVVGAQRGGKAPPGSRRLPNRICSGHDTS